MSREGGRARKEIPEANQQASVATPPGKETQGPSAVQRQGWPEKPAPWPPGRRLHHPGLGKAYGQALGPAGMGGGEVTDGGDAPPGSHQPEEAQLT